MDRDALSSSAQADLVALGRRLYDRALVRREDELITDPRGQPIGWLLDTRIPMLDSELFEEVGQVLADRLREASRRTMERAGSTYVDKLHWATVAAVKGDIAAHPQVEAVSVTEKRPGWRHDEEPVLAVDLTHVDAVDRDLDDAVLRADHSLRAAELVLADYRARP